MSYARNGPEKNDMKSKYVTDPIRQQAAIKRHVVEDQKQDTQELEKSR